MLTQGRSTLVSVGSLDMGGRVAGVSRTTNHVKVLHALRGVGWELIGIAMRKWRPENPIEFCQFRDMAASWSTHPAMSLERNVADDRPALGPPKQYRDELHAALDEADRGEFLDEATSAAYIRWLETGEGPCPWPVGSSS